jgi:Phosphatidylserine synthase
MNITKHIPNILTCLNIVSGCIAVVAGSVEMAACWIIIGAVFDFADGFAARMLKAYSPIGKDLDSLADMVTFGVAPGMIVFRLLSSSSCCEYLPYVAFIIPVFSALRLAKFNIDDRQTTSFIGLPVPAHALFWASLSCALMPVASSYGLAIVIGVIVLSIITSLLLVSEVPMFSLKIKSFAWRGNELRYLLVISAVLFIIFFGFLGLAGTILLYILLSVFNKKS